jgi:hypothetical protein
MNFNRLHESSSSRSIIDAVAEEESIPSNDDNGDANNGSVKRVALQKRYYSMERSKRKFKHSKIVPKDDVDDHDEEEKENENGDATIRRKVAYQGGYYSMERSRHKKRKIKHSKIVPKENRLCCGS